MSTLAVAERPRLGQLDVSLKRVPELLAVVGQLALALLVIQQFRLESRTFHRVAALTVAGFVVNAVLPRRLRLPFFVGVSATALILVLGVTDAGLVVAAGVGLVALCHLPIPFAARVALLLAVAGVLAAARAEVIPSPWSGAVWAVFGSMFMFRLALYLHALKHEPTRPTATQAAAYFLMVPNPVFPLFPVVDFTTFTRTHYAAGVDERETYQTGMTWIARGLVHLLLYRLVYHYLPDHPLRLESLRGLLWYLLGTFLLYLRVSGQFHLIVGMLRLYGFALPETHKLFFLSSSFTDFWRRINIYWKDFMMKLVYYPSFFRLRKLGGNVALVGATVTVFFLTWVLHSYQWFWILGSFLLTLPDMLFWALLGALVVYTSLKEAKRGRDRSMGARTWSGRLAFKVVTTFCALTVLWSLWSAESIIEWVFMWRAGARVGAVDLAVVAVLLAAGVAIAGRNWSAPQLMRAEHTAWWRRADVRTAATLLALLVLSRPEVAARAGPATGVLNTLRLTTLNGRDAAVERRGYYERLDHAPRLGAQGWEARRRRPAEWLTLPQTAAFDARTDFRIYDLKPNQRVTYALKPLTTNEWGYRDGPRTLAKPANTRRIAVIGPSIVLGTGVADGEQFSVQLERRLNERVSPETGVRYEALNFAAAGYSLLQELAMFEEDVVRFQPDVAVLTGYAYLSEHTTRHLSQVLLENRPIPYAGLDSVLQRWRVSTRLPWSELQGLLNVAVDDVHAFTIRRFAAESRRRGITPVLLLLDIVGTPPDRDVRLLRVAREEGIVVIDLFDVYGPPERSAALPVAEWDRHPNAAGHALVADSLLAHLRRHPRLLAPTPPTASPTSP